MGEHVTVKASDGNELDLYVARPEGEPAGQVIAGLVVVQEIFGVNAHMRSVTDGFARDGFLAVAPAMFDRFEKGVDLGYSKEDRQAAMAFVPKLDPIVSLADVEAAIEFARAESGGKVGVVGYCFGGSMAWLAATRLNGCGGGILRRAYRALCRGEGEGSGDAALWEAGCAYSCFGGGERAGE